LSLELPANDMLLSEILLRPKLRAHPAAEVLPLTKACAVNLSRWCLHGRQQPQRSWRSRQMPSRRHGLSHLLARRTALHCFPVRQGSALAPRIPICAMKQEYLKHCPVQTRLPAARQRAAEGGGPEEGEGKVLRDRSHTASNKGTFSSRASQGCGNLDQIL